MYKYQVEDFARYEVYEYINGQVHTICICDDYNIAKTIAKTIARMDPSCDTYYLTGINNPGDMIPGGGWYDSWHWDKETQLLVEESLS